MMVLVVVMTHDVVIRFIRPLTNLEMTSWIGSPPPSTLKVDLYRAPFGRVCVWG